MTTRSNSVGSRERVLVVLVALTVATLTLIPSGSALSATACVFVAPEIGTCFSVPGILPNFIGCRSGVIVGGIYVEYCL